MTKKEQQRHAREKSLRVRIGLLTTCLVNETELEQQQAYQREIAALQRALSEL